MAIARTGDALAAVLCDLAAEVERLRSFRSIPDGMVWQDYCSPDEGLRIRRPLDDEIERLRALIGRLESIAAQKAIAAHALGHGDVERGWLDVVVLTNEMLGRPNSEEERR